MGDPAEVDPAKVLAMATSIVESVINDEHMPEPFDTMGTHGDYKYEDELLVITELAQEVVRLSHANKRQRDALCEIRTYVLDENGFVDRSRLWKRHPVSLRASIASMADAALDK